MSLMFTKSQLPVIAILLYFTFSCNKEKPVTEVQEVQPENADTVVYEYLLKPDSLYKAGEYDSAIFYYEKAAERYLEKNDSLAHNRSIIRLALSHVNIWSDKKAIEKLNSLNFSPRTDDVINKDIADYYYTLGVAHNHLGNADSSEFYHLKAMAIRNKLYPNAHLDKVNSHMGLGNVYCYMLMDYENGQKHFEDALTELHKLQDTVVSSWTTFLCYYNLAATNRSRKNLNKAEFYANGALKIALETQNTKYLKYANQLLAGIYESKLDYKEAIQRFEKCLYYAKIDDPTNYQYLILNNNNLAINLRKEQRLENSIQAFKYGLDLITQHDLNLPGLKMEILANIGFTYHKMNDKLKAFDFLSQSLAISDILQEHHSKKYLPYHFLAVYYKEIKSYDEAIENYNKAIKILTRSNSISNGIITDYATTFEILIGLAKSYQLKAEQNSDLETNCLSNALHNYLLADSLIQVHRKANLLESDEVWLNDDIQIHYDDALACIKDLYLRNPSMQLIKVALKFIEQNKARILAKSLKKQEAFVKAGAPDSLVQHWNDIQQQIAFYQIQYRSNQQNKDQNKIIETKLLSLIQQEEVINNHFEDKFGSYFNYSLRPQHSVKPDSIQELAKSDKSIIISFYQGRSQITALTIRPDSTFLYFIDFNNELEECLVNYLKYLKEGNPSSKEEFKMYATVSYKLFQALIYPALQSLEDNEICQLTIVGDRLLATIPFESMIKSYPDTTNIDYKNLDYLTKEYDINYSYSLSFLNSKSPENNDSGSLYFGGWGYSQVNTEDKSLVFTEIKEANNELLKISKNFRSKLYLNEKATEASFKQDAANFDVLHLSIHGISSDVETPHVYFNSDHENDGFLYPFELYPIKLKAKMAVLSACETGKGKIHPGEGVFSIARGFFYAGCPSVLINLWNTKDQSSKDIQVDFYNNLVKGLNKSKSLQQAKLNFLKKSDGFTAHPRFWASSLIMGSASPIFYNQNISRIEYVKMSIGGIIFIIAMLIFIYKNSIIHIHSRIFGKVSK